MYFRKMHAKIMTDVLFLKNTCRVINCSGEKITFFLFRFKENWQIVITHCAIFFYVIFRHKNYSVILKLVCTMIILLYGKKNCFSPSGNTPNYKCNRRILLSCLKAITWSSCFNFPGSHHIKYMLPFDEWYTH